MVIQFTPQQRTFCALHYIKLNGTYGCIPRIQQLFAQRFPGVRIPERNTIPKMYRKLDTYHTTHNLNSKTSPSPTYSGRRKTATSAQNLARVRIVLNRDKDKRLHDPNASPRNSGRRNILGLSQSSWRRCVKELKFHPYRMRKSQKLQNGDYARRLNMCHHLSTLNQRQIRNTHFSDEANFTVDGKVNSQNVRCYSSKDDGPPDHFR